MKATTSAEDPMRPTDDLTHARGTCTVHVAKGQREALMRVSVLLVAIILSASAVADSCVTLEGATVVNKCQACMEVTVRALRPPGEPAATMFAGEPRSVRVEAGARSTVEGGERSAVTDLKACQ